MKIIITILFLIIIFEQKLFAAIDCNNARSRGFLYSSKEECDRLQEVTRLRALALCRYNAKDIKKERTKACIAAEDEEKKKHQEEVRKCMEKRSKYNCDAYAMTLTPEGAARVDRCDEATWERDRGVGEEGMYKGEVNWTGAKDSAQFAAYCGVEGGKEAVNSVIDAGKGAMNLAREGYNYVRDRITGVPRPVDNRSVVQKASDLGKAGYKLGEEQFNKIQIKFQCYTPRAQQEMMCIAAASNIIEGVATGGAAKLIKFAGVGQLALKAEGSVAKKVINTQIKNESIIEKGTKGLGLAKDLGTSTGVLPAESAPVVNP